MNRWLLAALALALATTACEGPMGPTGPQGDPGPGARLTFSGRLSSSGIAMINLPAEAGDMLDLPAVSVYVKDASSSAYAQYSTDSAGSTLTGFVGITPSLDGTHLVVGLIFASLPYWYYQVVVVY